MKKTILLFIVFLCLDYFSYSADNEVKSKPKVIHHIEFLCGSYVSQTFLSHRDNRFDNKKVFDPMYSFSLGFNYRVEFNRYIGLRTGINYFTYGSIESGISGDFPRTYKKYNFVSSIYVPLHIMVFKDLKKGRLVFSAGPDFYCPVDYFGKNTESGYSHSFNYTGVNSLGSNFGVSLGLTAGVGYEKQISKKLSIERMPDIRIQNIVSSNPYSSQPNYDNYELHFSIGVSTYIIFY